MAATSSSSDIWRQTSAYLRRLGASSECQRQIWTNIAHRTSTEREEYLARLRRECTLLEQYAEQAGMLRLSRDRMVQEWEDVYLSGTRAYFRRASAAYPQRHSWTSSPGFKARAASPTGRWNFGRGKQQRTAT
jgi:hypothetical protein